MLSTAAAEPGTMITDIGADLPLRRQDSNLDHRNQNPRCCRYTTADRPSHGPMGPGTTLAGHRTMCIACDRRRLA